VRPKIVEMEMITAELREKLTAELVGINDGVKVVWFIFQGVGNSIIVIFIRPDAPG